MIEVDRIVKNAKIFTDDKDKLNATARLSMAAMTMDLEGEVIDSHVHVARDAVFEYSDSKPFIDCTKKRMSCLCRGACKEKSRRAPLLIFA